MKNKKAEKQLQNRLRGLISSYKSTKITMGRTAPSKDVFNRNLKQLMFDAKSLIHHQNYDLFLDWVYRQLKLINTDPSRAHSDFGQLIGSNSRTPTLSISSELAWTSSFVKHNKDTINPIIEKAEVIENDIFSGRYKPALSKLDQLNSKYGMSIWGIQLKIALLHQTEGLESQKKYTSQVRSILKGSYCDYIAYFTSIRNEDRTTLLKYVDNLKRNINKSDANNATKSYIKYKLLSNLPISLDEISSVLKIEQNYSLIDVYFTLTNILQEIYKSHRNKTNEALLIKTLNNLDEIKDIRLSKLKIYLSTPPTETCKKKK